MTLIDCGIPRSEIGGLLDRIESGSSGLAAITGPTGIGKSTLLRAAAVRARSAGATVLLASGTRATRNEPFGVVDQIVAQSGCQQLVREPANPHDEQAEWLGVAERIRVAIARMAESRPVAIFIDDVQHADSHSVHCLRYLASHAHLMRLSLVFTCDPQENATTTVLNEIMHDPEMHSIYLSPLHSDDIGHFIGEFADGVENETAARFHRMSGGNPLLIRALVQDRAAAARAGGANSGEAFRGAVKVCLHRLGPLPTEIARCLAMLGPKTDEYQISALSEKPLGLVRAALERLDSGGLVTDLAFRHDEVRAIILGDTPDSTRIRMHHRAAQVMYAHGAASERIAEHLLVIGPVEDEWAMPILRNAVSSSLAERKIELAVQYLKLAIATTADDELRCELKTELAGLLWMIEPGSAPAHYQTLKSRAFTSQMAPHVALPLAQSLLWNGHVHDAVEVIDCVSAGLGSEQTAPPAPDTLAEVMATDLQIATSFPGVHRRVAAGPAHPDQIRLASAPAAAKVRVHLLLQNVLSGHGDALTAAQAEQSLHNSNLLDRSVSACVVPAVLALIYAGLLDPVQNAVTRLLEDATTTDLPGWAAVLHGLLGLIAMRRGELDVAVDHSSAALTPATQRPMDTHASLALATLAEAHTAIGNHDEAAAYFTFPIPPALFQTRSGLHYQYARGRHHLAAGRRYAALADFTACGEQMQQWSLDTANLAPWRIGAAEAWLALGQQQKAAALLEEQLAVRGLGAARTHGMALRTLAATREQCDRVGVLDRSARLLQASGDRYQLALSLADLSRAYRGVGDKDKARSAALRARRMAKVCHADTLCEALMATGPVEASWSAARERSIDRLSKSEQRVAALAARGLTNREIAEELFVTVSTVEQHLTRVYKKMDVRSREDLPAKLRAEAAA